MGRMSRSKSTGFSCAAAAGWALTIRPPQITHIEARQATNSTKRTRLRNLIPPSTDSLCQSLNPMIAVPQQPKRVAGPVQPRADVDSWEVPTVDVRLTILARACLQ